MKGSGMLTSQVLEPYAQALLSLGQAHNLTEPFGADVATILETLAASEELPQFLENPFVSTDTKKAVLHQVFGGNVHHFTESFLMLLVDRRRIMVLEGICKQYQALLRKLNQIELAQVTSTIGLTAAQIEQIKQRVLALTGAHRVELETAIDPDLIGGVIIKVGSQVIDASLRGQLRRISLRLAGAS
jgi:F-type H+-transporting ATPase subunit delta